MESENTKYRHRFSGHHFSGWSGAYCMKCFADDAMESAIGLGWYDPYTETWDTEEHKQECIRRSVCQFSDEEYEARNKKQTII